VRQTQLATLRRLGYQGPPPANRRQATDLLRSLQEGRARRQLASTHPEDRPVVVCAGCGARMFSSRFVIDPDGKRWHRHCWRVAQAG
jgi:hypothetical protein